MKTYKKKRNNKIKKTIRYNKKYRKYSKRRGGGPIRDKYNRLNCEEKIKDRSYSNMVTRVRCKRLGNEMKSEKEFEDHKEKFYLDGKEQFSNARQIAENKNNIARNALEEKKNKRKEEAEFQQELLEARKFAKDNAEAEQKKQKKIKAEEEAEEKLAAKKLAAIQYEAAALDKQLTHQLAQQKQAEKKRKEDVERNAIKMAREQYKLGETFVKKKEFNAFEKRIERILKYNNLEMNDDLGLGKLATPASHKGLVINEDEDPVYLTAKKIPEKFLENSNFSSELINDNPYGYF
jgi:hypothetical protein